MFAPFFVILLAATCLFAGGDKKPSVLDPLLDRTALLMDDYLKKLDRTSALENQIAVSIEEDLKHLEQLFTTMTMPATTAPTIVRKYCVELWQKAKREIASTSDQSLKRRILQQAWEAIGQTVFLAERVPHEAAACIELDDLSLSEQRMRMHCSKAIDAYVKSCNQYREVQKQAGIQDPDLSLSFFQAEKIAQMLLTLEGKLNVGMISLLIPAFVPEESPLEYQIGMKRVLFCMNSGWQPVLDTIMKPHDQHAAGAEAIRADLGLSHHVHVTNYHCKCAALKALLSQLCQGAVGDCFAVSWAIKKHNEYFMQSLKDYGELIQHGCLTRSVNGIPDQFFFKNTVADTDLQKSITLLPSGHLKNGIMSWRIPCIVAACKQMGIDHVYNQVMKAIQSLFQDGKSSVEIALQDFIACLATYSEQDAQVDKNILVQRGIYGFSLTQNHLLRAWETALAGMSEAKRGDYVRDDVVFSVGQALKSFWESYPSDERAIALAVRTDFEKLLNQHNRFVYNAAIGGFELYKRDLHRKELMGERVATPRDFTAYLVEVLNAATAATERAFPEEEMVIQKIAGQLEQYIAGSTNHQFLNNVLLAFDDSNRKIPDPVAHYATLSMTPMTALTGDDPYAVEAIDTGVSFLPYVKRITPHSPYALIEWILELAEWKEETQHYLEDANPFELDPAANPEHAFNIAFEDANIKSFVQSKETAPQWLLEHALQPNDSLEKSIVDEMTKERFSKAMVQWLFHHVLSEAKHLEDGIALLNQKNVTLKQYADLFFKMIADLFPNRPGVIHQLELVFDTILINSLPQPMVEQLSEGAILFAKTNWNDGDKNIYFCTFFNVRTGALSFGTIDEDRTALYPMSEYEWVDQQTWEVVPYDKVPA